MNALMWLLKIVSIVPVIVSGINTLHADKDVATKTQLAHEVLDLSVAGAKALAPEHAATIDSAAALAKQAIATSNAIATDCASTSAVTPVVG